MPELSNDITKVAKDFTNVAKDAAYVAVGVGVMGFQRAQVRRRELAKQLAEPRARFETRVQGARADLSHAVVAVDERLEELFTQVDSAVGPLTDRLPDRAATLAKQVHSQATETRQQIRSAIRGAAG